MLQTLPEIQGEPCPNCGCRDGSTVSEYRRQGVVEFRVCRHCGRRWRTGASGRWSQKVEQGDGVGVVGKFVKAVATVVVGGRVMKCPHCGGVESLARSTTAKAYYRRCRGCGGNFKVDRE